MLRTLVCTGCTSGLGYEALRQLLATSPAQWTVFAGARDPATARPVLDSLVAGRQHDINVIHLDLTDLKSVQQFASDVKARLSASASGAQPPQPVTVLLNAGVYKPRTRLGPGPWIEEAVVNSFAQHNLIQLLEPLLVKSSAIVPSRLVFVSSSKQNSVESLEALEQTLRDPKAPAMSRYSASKLAQMINATWWKKTLSDDGVEVVAVSPGFVPTSGLDRDAPFLQRLFMHYVLSWAPFVTTLEKGSGLIRLAIEPTPPLADSIAQFQSQSDVLYIGPSKTPQDQEKGCYTLCRPSALVGRALERDEGARTWAPGREEVGRWADGHQ